MIVVGSESEQGEPVRWHRRQVFDDPLEIADSIGIDRDAIADRFDDSHALLPPPRNDGPVTARNRHVAGDAVRVTPGEPAVNQHLSIAGRT